MGAVQQDLQVLQGKTFAASFGWAQGRFVWKPITGVAQAAPVALTVPGHDLRDGWPFWVFCLKRPASLNTGCDEEPSAPYIAEVVDENTLSINHINGLCLDAYAGGGVIRYYERADITDFSALMQVRRSPADTNILFEASSIGPSPMILVDADAATFQLEIPADAFVDKQIRDAEYEIEITAPTGEKYRLARGRFNVCQELVK